MKLTDKVTHIDKVAHTMSGTTAQLIVRMVLREAAMVVRAHGAGQFHEEIAKAIEALGE